MPYWLLDECSASTRAVGSAFAIIGCYLLLFVRYYVTTYGRPELLPVVRALMAMSEAGQAVVVTPFSYTGPLWFKNRQKTPGMLCLVTSSK